MTLLLHFRNMAYFRRQARQLSLHRWGSQWERQRLAELRVPKRRREWLLGRLTAKELLARQLRRLPRPAGRDLFPLLEIRNDPMGAPYCRFLPPLEEQMAARFAISIAHAQGVAAVLCLDKRSRTVERVEGGPAVLSLPITGIPQSVGIDLEKVEPRVPAFGNTFFGEMERRQVAETDGKWRAAMETAIWTGKEALSKAWGCGLTFDTRRVQVLLPPPPWKTWTACDMEGELFPAAGSSDGFSGAVQCWIRRFNDFIVAVVVRSQAGPRRRNFINTHHIPNTRRQYSLIGVSS